MQMPLCLHATAVNAMAAPSASNILTSDYQTESVSPNRFMRFMRKFATVSKVGQGCAVSAQADLWCLLTPDDAKSH